MAVTVLAEADPTVLFTSTPRPGGTDRGSAIRDAVTYLDPGSTDVSVFDLGLLRGDGVFEATEVNHGVALALRLHVRRLGRSARIADLPPIDEEAWIAVLSDVVAHYDADEPGMLKVIVTRGADGSTNPGKEQDPGVPHVWVFIDEKVPSEAKPEQISVITLAREIVRDSVSRAPWLLLGAKTLSYAMNMSVVREAARHGSDNAILTTLDGFVLEGPKSNVVVRTGQSLLTPDPRIGILHGTTQQEMFAFAASRGLTVGYGDLTVEDLRRADQIWMTGGSTVQAVAELDGEPVATDLDFTRAANDYMRTQRAAVDAYTLTAPSPFEQDRD